ncbi:MAG: hypothetical protein QXR68_08155 [Pyrobaculum sp.]
MPTWQTHRRLAILAAGAVGVGGELLRGLLAGVVEPDVARDRERVCGKRRCYYRDVRHHGGYLDKLVEYYYNLACFYKSRGDLYRAGVALGRAMHYLHDDSVKTRKWAIFDVHDEVEKGMEYVSPNCDAVVARRSTNPEEAFCLALRRSVELLKRFVEEPVVDLDTARRLLWRGRWKKASAYLAAWLPTLLTAVASSAYFPFFFIASIIATYILLSWTPWEYTVAMRAGLEIFKPDDYETAM